jgi:hypothetical protein
MKGETRHYSSDSAAVSGEGSSVHTRKGEEEGVSVPGAKQLDWECGKQL